VSLAGGGLSPVVEDGLRLRAAATARRGGTAAAAGRVCADSGAAVVTAGDGAAGAGGAGRRAIAGRVDSGSEPAGGGKQHGHDKRADLTSSSAVGWASRPQAGWSTALGDHLAGVAAYPSCDARRASGGSATSCKTCVKIRVSRSGIRPLSDVLKCSCSQASLRDPIARGAVGDCTLQPWRFTKVSQIVVGRT
jgi:hypothetical protein